MGIRLSVSSEMKSAYTRCENCGRKWSGFNEAHCRKCHRHFSTVEVFDAHLTRTSCHNPQPPSRFFESSRASGLVWAQSAQLRLPLVRGRKPLTVGGSCFL